jgi:hypothetical protein
MAGTYAPGHDENCQASGCCAVDSPPTRAHDKKMDLSVTLLEYSQKTRFICLHKVFLFYPGTMKALNIDILSTESGNPKFFNMKNEKNEKYEKMKKQKSF